MNARFAPLALLLCAMTVFAAEEKNGLDPNVHDDLRKVLREGPDTAGKLRALWTLHTTGGLDIRTTLENLKSTDEWVRAWTIQLSFENSETLERLLREANKQGLKTEADLYKLAESDPSP